MSGRGHESHRGVPLRQALEAASAVVGAPLRRVATLGGSRRTDVWRVTDGASTYVVKAYRSTDGDTWAREPAALRALVGGPVPTLVGVADDPRLVVMADLGEHPTVADALMGDDGAAARTAVTVWAEGLAHLHTAGRDAVPGFTAALGGRAPGRSPHELPDSARAAAETFDELLPGLETDAPGGLAALTGVVGLLAAAPPVLSPGDTCPDNNLRRPDGLVFLDLEWAEVRAAAWDVAYLRVPWPTCWCAWLLPDDVADAALAAYRSTAAVADHDLAVAVAAWCLLSTGLFLGTALERHRANTDTARMPGRRTMILHRLAQAAAADDVAGLGALADAMHHRLHRRWGDHPPRLAPAFR